MSNFKVYLMQTQTARGCVDVKAYNAHDAIELVKQMIDDYSIDEKIKHKNIVDYNTWKIDDLEAKNK